MPIRFFTAGESHGPELTAIVEGMPAGIPVDSRLINADLARRQQGYGRGGRMAIERDRVEILSGVRWGETLGSPVTMVVRNRDWENWREKMSVDPSFRDPSIAVTQVRPGHADLPGMLKYGHRDARNILERSSARETAARVAVGSLCRQFLSLFDIQIAAYVRAIGGVEAATLPDSWELLLERVASSPLFTPDPAAEQEMVRLIDHAKSDGDSLGGVVEVIARGVPVGLGSHVQWDRRLDARLAMAVMSVQAIKGVEIGAGFAAASLPGSRVHDPIRFDRSRPRAPRDGGFYRISNNAGGIEGGISNGEDIVIRCGMKPIPTLYSPLETVDFNDKSPVLASVERSDVCAVPAASVAVEAAVAFVIADAFLEKFGGDSLAEILRNVQSWYDYLQTV
ncbi:MAG: chorismate synthase [Desulfuromonadia bacterium]